jgi:hypothetical protein
MEIKPLRTRNRVIAGGVPRTIAAKPDPAGSPKSKRINVDRAYPTGIPTEITSA